MLYWFYTIKVKSCESISVSYTMNIGFSCYTGSFENQIVYISSISISALYLREFI